MQNFYSDLEFKKISKKICLYFTSKKFKIAVYLPRVGNSLINFLSESQVFVSERTIRLWKRANHSRPSFVMRNGSEFSQSLFWKERQSEELLGIKGGKKLTKTYEKYNFSSESLLFWEQFIQITSKYWCCSFLKKSRVIRSRLLFCHERPEQITHGCSFVKSDESNLLMVALF